MPVSVSVSMHACSAWPMNIDFTVFRFFLRGYSVEETVEQLMAMQSVTVEKPQSKRRSSSASSDSVSPSSSALGAHSPANSTESSSPTTSTPHPQRGHTHHPPRDRARESSPTAKGRHGKTGSTTATEAALQAAEAALLTEDRRVVAAEDEHAEEVLVVSPTSRKPAANLSAVSLDMASPRTPTAPTTTTAVDTSTNSARQPHRASAPMRQSTTFVSDTPSTKQLQSPSYTQPSQQQQQQRDDAYHHRSRHQHSSRHHHRSGKDHTHTQEFTSHHRKSKHSAATRSSSTQQTSTTNTAATSFALPPMWGYDGNTSVPNTANSASNTSPQHTRFSSAIASMDDFNTGDTATSRTAANGASTANNNNNNSTGKNSSSENRRAGRPKKRKERQCFFLNEDYIKFQRQLQEVEAIGGAGMGASSLQSRYLFEEVTEQFQAFRELAREEQLGSPYAFLSNYYVPIPVAMRLELLQMYYETDPGLFRWAFGDKLNRFDLPGALAAVRDEVLSGNLSSSNLSKSIFNSTSGTLGALNGGNGSMLGLGGQQASNASIIGGGGGSGSGGSSFWSGRWKSSPGKLATMDATTLIRLGEQHTDALRRQWDNVKHVCVTVAALYRGKGGMCVPLDMALLTTIQQCFGLRQEQALDYATAAFGYEHRLETRLFDRLHTFSEYGAICSVVASLWCDDSAYFLSESFRTGCRRIGRLLDEYRFLSELHPFLFGEPMRPRWQVQLDEVQRVITTSSLVEKNAVASAAATAVGAGSPVTATAAVSPSGTISGIGSNTNLAGLANNGRGAAASGSAAGGGLGGGGVGGGTNTLGMSGSSNFGTGSGSGAGYGANGGGAGLNGSGSLGWDNGGGNGASPTATNSNVHSLFSGNGQYSRRFLMEFPSLMKHLLRVCAALGNNGGVNDALDIFFTRIYTYLEVLSSRTAPALVNMVMSATASGGLAAVAGAASAAGLSTLPGSFAGASPSATASAAHLVPSPSFGRPPLPPHVERPRSHSDLTRVGGLDASSLSPPPAASSSASMRLGGAGQPGLTRVMSTPVLPSTSVGADGTRRAGATSHFDGSPLSAPAPAAVSSSESRAASSTAEDVLVPGSSVPYAVSAVVNTSLFHPASALIPLSAAIAAHNANTAGFTSSPLTAVPSGRGFSAEEELPSEWVGDATAATSAVTAGRGGTNASFLGASGSTASSALFTSQVSDMVRKAVDKRYLRELCMLLAALPKAWRQLTVLTPEDHAVTDKTMSDLAMALKAITQVLMASDDFH